MIRQNLAIYSFRCTTTNQIHGSQNQNGKWLKEGIGKIIEFIFEVKQYYELKYAYSIIQGKQYDPIYSAFVPFPLTKPQSSSSEGTAKTGHWTP